MHSGMKANASPPHPPSVPLQPPLPAAPHLRVGSVDPLKYRIELRDALLDALEGAVDLDCSTSRCTNQPSNMQAAAAPTTTWQGKQSMARAGGRVEKQRCGAATARRQSVRVRGRFMQTVMQGRAQLRAWRRCWMPLLRLPRDGVAHNQRPADSCGPRGRRSYGRPTVCAPPLLLMDAGFRLLQGMHAGALTRDRPAARAPCSLRAVAILDAAPRQGTY